MAKSKNTELQQQNAAVADSGFTSEEVSFIHFMIENILFNRGFSTADFKDTKDYELALSIYRKNGSVTKDEPKKTIGFDTGG